MGQAVIVDDDRFSAELLRQWLTLYRFEAVVAETALAALEAVRARPTVLVVLDLDLPDASGIDLCCWIRQTSPTTGILVISGYSGETHRRRALEAGADDYLCKPIMAAEAVSRARAIVRQRAQAPSGASQTGGVHLDPVLGTLSLPDGRHIALTPSEARLMAVLLTHPGAMLTRYDLARLAWSDLREPPSQATIDLHLRRLRIKLDADRARPPLLHVLRGVGVCFVPPAPQPARSPR
jgi:two-component system phosphate regulon response regulator PhoB